MNAAPLVPTSGPRPRRVSPRDLARVAEVERLVAEGATVSDATWSVLSGEALGYERFRAPGVDRPSDATLRRKRLALIARASPEIVEKARAVASAALASHAEEAAGVVVDLMRGEFGEARVRTRGDVESIETDSGAARVRLESAALVLRTVGLGDRGGASVNVAVQTNIVESIAEKIRAAQTAREPGA